MNLTDREIKLKYGRSDDADDYLISLAGKYKYSSLPPEERRKALCYIKHFWTGEAYGHRAGVVYICRYPEVDWWTLDAYRDDDVLKEINTKGNYSYRAGKLVIDWFFEKKIAEDLLTMHDERNRAATLVCQKLGFEEDGFIQNFIRLKLRRSTWESRQS